MSNLERLALGQFKLTPMSFCFSFVGSSTVPGHLRSSPTKTLYSTVEEPCRSLSTLLTQSLQLLEDTLVIGFDLPTQSRNQTPSELLSQYQKNHDELNGAVKALKLHLSVTHASLDQKKRETGNFRTEADDYAKEFFAISLFTVSLLQVRIYTYPVLHDRLIHSLDARLACCRYGHGDESWQDARTETPEAKSTEAVVAKNLESLFHLLYHTSCQHIRRQ